MSKPTFKCLSFFLFFILPYFLHAYDLDAVKIKKTYKEEGIEISALDMEKSFDLYYRFYNPFYKTYSEGKLKPNKSLYIPYETEICLWLKNKKGQGSPVTHFTAKKRSEKNTVRVLSPLDGTWNKKQRLIVEADPDVQILYSADGSDPARFGLIYTGPVLLDKGGTVQLRIKAVDEAGLITEKKVSYTVSYSGKPDPDLNTFSASSQTEEKKQSYKLLNWYFAQFDFDKPVYYSLLKPEDPPPLTQELSQLYDGPVFVNRESDAVLYWTSESAGEGVNKIELPKKPSFTGAPEKEVNKSVELQFDDRRYTYFFEAEGTYLSGDLFRAENNRYIFDCAPKTEKPFNLKISVWYGGVLHGALYTDFKIDKIPPEKPKVTFTPSYSQANTPVTIAVEKNINDSAVFVADVTPPLYVKNDDGLILVGTEDGPVSYSVSIYNEDAAGNRSPAVKKELTVDRNSIYVDYTAGHKNANGNPSNPFPTLYEAVNYITGSSPPNTVVPDFRNDKWKIYLRGDCVLSEAVLIRRNIKIIASDKRPEIRFLKNSGFIVHNSYFEIENCDIVRKEYPEEPREVPLIYGTNSAIKLNNVKLHAVEGGGVLTVFDSHIHAAGSEIISEQTGTCVIFDINNSSAVLQNLRFTGKGFSTVAISASGSTVEAEDIHCSLTPVFAARTVEAWNSEITLGKLQTIRLPEDKRNKDKAVWLNKKSKVDFLFEPMVRGYFKAWEQEP